MISVIIPAYNAEKTISECVLAIQNQSNVPYPFEIIVVDDGSTDRTADLAEKCGARVIKQANRGPATARNKGIEAASGEIVCFTDADCIPTQNWLYEVTSPLLANEEIAGAKGIYISNQKELTARFVQYEYENKYERLRQYEYITFMDFYSAAYRRSILLENKFNERFTMANNEDRELSYRLAGLGYKMLYQPSAVVGHFHANSIRSYFRKKFWNGYWTAQVLRQFPNRLIEDTYNPHLQKVQVGLMGVIVATAVLSLLIPFLLPLLILFAFFFLLTTIPFTIEAWKKDKAVGVISPFMLGIDALALGLGYSYGLVRPISQT